MVFTREAVLGAPCVPASPGVLGCPRAGSCGFPCERQQLQPLSYLWVCCSFGRIAVFWNVGVLSGRTLLTVFLCLCVYF